MSDATAHLTLLLLWVLLALAALPAGFLLWLALQRAPRPGDPEDD